MWVEGMYNNSIYSKYFTSSNNRFNSNIYISGVAADGTDFTGVSSVIIPAGQTKTFTIATLDDNLAEGAENFFKTPFKGFRCSRWIRRCKSKYSKQFSRNNNYR